ncbi:MAG TPA: Eco29kI family restriction endonuclease [Pirellulales bacterium]|nr:Eco29kI family restriction endonuclease [Pirellulales bacterium]
MPPRPQRKRKSIDFSIDLIIERLSAIAEIALPDPLWAGSNAPGCRKLLKKLREVNVHLAALEDRLDDVLLPDSVFDLTNPETIGEVIVYRLEQSEKVGLSSIKKFYGSGVYAFYYEGDLPAYGAIKKTNCPIYVGSASPKTPNAATPRLQGTKLFGRINEHFKKSIKQSSNLDDHEFLCRFLVVQSGLEKAAEDFLIRRYSPVWNKESRVCSGIGKHGDIARKELSAWDVLHGSRQWTAKQTSRQGRTPQFVIDGIQKHFLALLAEDREKWTAIFADDWLAKNGC